jgi:predicted transcriptional regulator
VTRLLEKAIERVRSLPPERQDALAHAMLAVASGGEPEAVDPAHLADLEAGLAEAREGMLASEDEIRAAFGRFGG